MNVELGKPLVISLTAADGGSGLFPRAFVYDSSPALVATIDLTEFGTTGRYTDKSFIPLVEDVFIALLIVYNDAGHLIESQRYERAETDFTVDAKLRYVHKWIGGVAAQQVTHVDAVIGTPGSTSTPDLEIDQTVTKPNATTAVVKQA